MATPAELAAGSSCLSCSIPPGMAQAVQIYLLQQIASNTMTPTELNAAAACFACIPTGMQGAVIIYLLDQIQQGGGGGGGSGVTCSPSSDPSGTPTGNCGIWVRLDLGRLWVYNSGTASWDLYLS